MKALVGAFNQEKALVGAFSVIVQLSRLIDLRHDQNIKSQNYLFEIVEKSCDKWSKKKEMHIYHTIASSFPQCVNEVLTEWVAA